MHAPMEVYGCQICRANAKGFLWRTTTDAR